MDLTKVDIFCDGACSGNPGQGGWAFVIRTEKAEKRASNWVPNTTNNRMEIRAVLEALRTLDFTAALKAIAPNDVEVTVHTDSQYVINIASGGWRIRKNGDLWNELFTYIKKWSPKFIHTQEEDSQDIQACDACAKSEARSGASPWQVWNVYDNMPD